MLRFTYRSMWAAPDPLGQSPPSGWLGRLIRLITAKSADAPQRPIRASDNLPRPIVPIRIRGPVAARRLKSALLDTGSQDTLFPMALAQSLGILLGGERRTIGWRGQRYWVEFHDVELELSQNDRVWRWRARAGFTDAPLSYALLGQRGCLDFWDAKFYGADQIVELEVNRNYSDRGGTAT